MRGVQGVCRIAVIVVVAFAGCTNSVQQPGSGQLGSADGVAPSIVSVSPANGETGVPVTGGVIIELSEPLSSVFDPATLSVGVTGGDPVAGELDLQEKVLTFTPDQAFLYDTAYTVSVEGSVADGAGNTATLDTDWTFTTESSPNLIYVSPEGSDANDGLTAGAALRTIASGMASAVAEGRPMVALAPGVYTESVELVAGVIISGHTATWKPAIDPSLVVIRPGSTVGGEPAVAVSVTNVSSAVGMRNLTIEAPDGTPGPVSGSSYGFYANQASEVELVNLVIYAGDGARGSDGQAGESASGIPAESGGPGYHSVKRTGCSTNGRGGGSGAEDGGGGGLSGQSDRSCGGLLVDYTPSSGSAGADSAETDGESYGQGGSGGSVGHPGDRGQDGRPGTDGSAGDGADVSGTVVDEFWTTASVASGTSGGTGTAGTSGGGGGGGGGYGDSSGGHPGGGGGGGGAGGAPALSGGSGGTGGGSSFGVFGVDSILTLTDVTIQRGRGGAGGDGGAGGSGQPGGSGGPGGAGDESVTGLSGIDLSGGDGGDGGRGGHSGGGGGGAGGDSVAILSLDSPMSQDGTHVVGGAGGAGGQGGSGAAGNDGDPGKNGTVRGFWTR